MQALFPTGRRVLAMRTRRDSTSKGSGFLAGVTKICWNLKKQVRERFSNDALHAHKQRPRTALLLTWIFL